MKPPHILLLASAETCEGTSDNILSVYSDVYLHRAKAPELHPSQR